MADAMTEIRGIIPGKELCPNSEAELSEILSRANTDGAVCYLAGGLTKPGWGSAPKAVDILLRTTGLSGCSDVDPDNLTLTAGAGTTVAEARARAAEVGRILPVDPGRPDQATIGGVVATGDQGCRAAGYGGLRDVVLGVRATLADGSAVKFGGRTMKNVTGYDMTKLFVGSFGILGAITEVTFRLLPRPDAQALVVLPLASLDHAKAAVARVLSSYLQPLALEVVSTDALPPDFMSSSAKLPGGRAAAAAPATAGARIAAGRPLLLAGFGGHRAAVERSVGEVTAAHPGIAAQILRDDAAEILYAHLATSATRDQTRLRLRASVPISRALDVVGTAQEYAGANKLAVGYRAGAARGRVDLLFRPAGGDSAGSALEASAAVPDTAEAENLAGCLSAMRAQAVSMGGSLFVTGGASYLPSGYDAWGDVGPALAIMKRIKERFDPKGILNPGRFVGGL
jgi:glycolate oxidase FAD binding subunit